ncbi:MAG: Gfo/Idh/MocA family oxidoreductase [Lachnospiraceae bacterium]|nr:Gfo/Idh/MocA family oxidoreductase [Lachnospiraceae bacterium]
MKIVVVGLGSMGRRRIRLLKQISPDFDITGVDGKTERCQQAEEELHIDTCESLEEALENKKPQCAIISTSPLSHAGIIETCLAHDCHVFTELNLVSDQYETNMSLAKEKGKVLFLSSTFLYRDEIRFIRDKVQKTEGALNYNYHVGQYLPDWHPWESIQDYFVGDKRTNGCRELFAIELPWIIKLFGKIASYQVISSKNTKLPIQYNDNYLLLITHANGNKGVLGVDVVSRKAVRNLEVYGEELYLTWDGTPFGLKEYDIEKKEENNINLYENVDQQDGYASFVIENAYKAELQTFLELTSGKGKAEHTFEEDLEVLAMIDQIEAGEGK